MKDLEKHLKAPIFKNVALAAQHLNSPAYVIGGFVRDILLDRPSKDIDFVCQGSGIHLATETAKHFSSKLRVNVFKRFGTAHFNYKSWDYEFVGARKESYRDDSRKPIVEDGTLEDDQNRRDFTINAMAIDLSKENFGKLIDPFNGIEDLKNKIIRTPLEPDTTFSDDPLRIMRAIRFACQLNFRIESETFDSIKRNRDRIKIISQERITDELNKIMLSPVPSVGFKLLFDTGVLQYIFPELERLHGIETKGGISHKDNFYHSIKVLDNICPHTDNLWLRWATLLHDIAKPISKRFQNGHGWTFHGHEVLGGKMVPKIFKNLRLPLDGKMKYVQKLVSLHHRPVALANEKVTDSGIRRLLMDAGIELDDLLTLCRADITSKNEEKVKRFLKNFDYVEQRCKEVEEKDQLRDWQPPISGEMIMKAFNIKPSREVGEIKNLIREAILDGVIENNFDEAHAFMISEGEKMGLFLNQ